MGRDTDFDFGWNQTADNLAPWGKTTGPDTQRRSSRRGKDAIESTGPVSNAVPEWQEICCNQVLKMIRQLTETVRKANRQPMDLASYRSSDKSRAKFENREWIDSQKDLPKKGSSKWKIDSVREAKKNKTGILLFVDIANGSKKRVMSLRKGFTLDAFIDELGSKSDKWTGKAISLERGGDEGQYVNVAQ